MRFGRVKREPLTVCAVCEPAAAERPLARGGTVLRVGMLGTLTSKFAFQKQVLESLNVTSTTANAVSKFAAFGRKK